MAEQEAAVVERRMMVPAHLIDATAQILESEALVRDMSGNPTNISCIQSVTLGI
jgi:hypothetical protein